MLAKIVNDVVQKYPYTIAQLRKDNPNISFPKNPSPETLASFNVFEVISSIAPEVDHTQDVGEGFPQKINGVWTQHWLVETVNETTLAQRTADKAANVREQRDQLLKSTDWVVIKHLERNENIPGVWEVYRQALRDVPEQGGFPWDVTWPVAPDA